MIPATRPASIAADGIRPGGVGGARAAPRVVNEEDPHPPSLLHLVDAGLHVKAGHHDRGGYPARAGGLWLWLCSTLVWSGFRAVVVPSGFSTRVQPQRWITI